MPPVKECPSTAVTRPALYRAQGRDRCGHGRVGGAGTGPQGRSARLSTPLAGDGHEAGRQHGGKSVCLVLSVGGKVRVLPTGGTEELSDDLSTSLSQALSQDRRGQGVTLSSSLPPSSSLTLARSFPLKISQALSLKRVLMGCIAVCLCAQCKEQ